MSIETIFAVIAGVIGTLLGIIYKIHTSTLATVWAAVDRKPDEQDMKDTFAAKEVAFTQYRHDQAERMREMQKEFNSRLTELATRQDREVDALKAHMLRVSSELGELRRDVNAQNLAIMERLQEITLLVRRTGP